MAVTRISSTHNSDSSDIPSVTVSKPSGATAGRLLLAQAVYTGGNAHQQAPTADDGGWIIAHTPSGTTQNHGRWWYRVLTGSEGSSFGFSGHFAVTSRRLGVTLSVWDGIDTSSPLSSILSGNSTVSTLNLGNLSVSNGAAIVASSGAGAGTLSMSSPWISAVIDENHGFWYAEDLSDGSYAATITRDTGASSMLGIAAIINPVPPIPDVPTGVNITDIGMTEARYTWDNMPGADSYIVQRRLKPED